MTTPIQDREALMLVVKDVFNQLAPPAKAEEVAFWIVLGDPLGEVPPLVASNVQGVQAMPALAMVIASIIDMEPNIKDMKEPD